MGKKTLAMLLAVAAIFATTATANQLKNKIQAKAQGWDWMKGNWDGGKKDSSSNGGDGGDGGSPADQSGGGSNGGSGNGGNSSAPDWYDKWCWDDSWWKKWDWKDCGCDVPDVPDGGNGTDNGTSGNDTTPPVIPPSGEGEIPDQNQTSNETYVCKWQYDNSTKCFIWKCVPKDCACENDTVPDDNGTVPGNESGGGQNITNCTTSKVCRARNYSCYNQHDWADYMQCGSGCGSGSYHHCKKQKSKRRRVCNFTEDATFDHEEFLANSSYYGDCDCAIFQNCTEVPVIPPPVIPPIPPSGGNCSFTCQDIQFLQFAVTNLTNWVTYLNDQVDLLVSASQDHEDRITALEDGGSGGLGSGAYDDLVDAINAIPQTATTATMEYIRKNGVRFGDIWWFGAQFNQLFAIDTRAQSYYKFQQGVTKTL